MHTGADIQKNFLCLSKIYHVGVGNLPLGWECLYVGDV